MLESFESQKARQINGVSPTAKVSPTKRKQNNPKLKQLQTEGQEAVEKNLRKGSKPQSPLQKEGKKGKKKGSCVCEFVETSAGK